MVNVCLLYVSCLCLLGVEFLVGGIRSGGLLWVKICDFIAELKVLKEVRGSPGNQQCW